MTNVMTRLRDLHAQVNEIFLSEQPWETKYVLIFSKHISRQVFDDPSRLLRSGHHVSRRPDCVRRGFNSKAGDIEHVRS